MNGSITKSALAEMIGTFALCFIGILAISGAEIVRAADPNAALISVALAHGLTIAVMVAALGAVSGGHFNPAVTFGFVVTGRMPVGKGLVYGVAQLLGAFIAGGILVALFGGPSVGKGTPNLGEGVSMTAGILLEAVTTFFLVLVIFGTAVDERAPRAVFPLAIGLTVALDILAIGPLTGGAMNPARTFGPALASGQWANHLVYWVGPLIGGALGALAHQAIFMERAPTPAIAEHGGPAPAEQRTTTA